MTELGFKVARHILNYEDGMSAAAILVFVGLHTAYNSVLAVGLLKKSAGSYSDIRT